MRTMEELEEKIAHLERMVGDLSEEVARQAKEVTRLTAVAQLLAEREAEREAGEGQVILADQRPPHW